MLITFNAFTAPLYIIMKRLNLYCATLPASPDELWARGPIDIDSEIAQLQKCIQHFEALPNLNANHFATVPHSLYKSNRDFLGAHSSFTLYLKTVKMAAMDIRHIQILASMPEDDATISPEQLIKLKCIQNFGALYLNLLDHTVGTDVNRHMPLEVVQNAFAGDSKLRDDSLRRILDTIEKVDLPAIEEGLSLNEIAALLASITETLERIRDISLRSWAIIPGLLEQSEKLNGVALALYRVWDPNNIDFPSWDEWNRV